MARTQRETPNAPLSKDQFSVIEILGKGGFGKVYKVEYRKNRTLYAMKEMSKSV
jgi:protein kinase A